MRRRSVRLGWALELAQLGLESWMVIGRDAGGAGCHGVGSGNPQQPASNRAQGDRALSAACEGQSPQARAQTVRRAVASKANQAMEMPAGRTAERTPRVQKLYAIVGTGLPASGLGS